MQVQVQIVGLTLVLDIVWSAYVLKRCYFVPVSENYFNRPSRISKNRQQPSVKHADLILQACRPMCVLLRGPMHILVHSIFDAGCFNVWRSTESAQAASSQTYYDL